MKHSPHLSLLGDLLEPEGMYQEWKQTQLGPRLTDFGPRVFPCLWPCYPYPKKRGCCKASSLLRLALEGGCPGFFIVSHLIDTICFLCACYHRSEHQMKCYVASRIFTDPVLFHRGGRCMMIGVLCLNGYAGRESLVFLVRLRIIFKFSVLVRSHVPAVHLHDFLGVSCCHGFRSYSRNLRASSPESTIVVLNASAILTSSLSVIYDPYGFFLQISAHSHFHAD